MAPLNFTSTQEVPNVSMPPSNDLIAQLISQITTAVTNAVLASIQPQTPPLAANYSILAPTPTTTVHAGHHRFETVCEPFSGSESLTSVEVWLEFFELSTLEYSVFERLVSFGKYLTGDAKNWAARELLPRKETITWDEVVMTCRRLN